jgi:hypothetical protein
MISQAEMFHQQQMEMQMRMQQEAVIAEEEEEEAALLILLTPVTGRVAKVADLRHGAAPTTLHAD